MSPIGYAIETSFAATESSSTYSDGLIRTTHEISARPSVMISESITPGRSPSGLRRRTRISSPAISAG
jgi:hypothetical protein